MQVAPVVPNLSCTYVDHNALANDAVPILLPEVSISTGHVGSELKHGDARNLCRSLYATAIPCRISHLQICFSYCQVYMSYIYIDMTYKYMCVCIRPALCLQKPALAV